MYVNPSGVGRRREVLRGHNDEREGDEEERAEKERKFVQTGHLSGPDGGERDIEKNDREMTGTGSQQREQIEDPGQTDGKTRAHSQCS